MLDDVYHMKTMFHQVELKIIVFRKLSSLLIMTNIRFFQISENILISECTWILGFVVTKVNR